MTEFDDFRLRLSADGAGAYVATATTAEGEEATVSFALPFGRADLENLVLRIGRVRSVRRARLQSEVKRVESFGEDLFSAVFHDDVKDVFRKAKARADAEDRGLRLVLSLRNGAELLDVPWEFLYDRPYFFGLQRRTPLVRYLELSHTRRAQPIVGPARFLGMVSSPRTYDPLDVAHEQALVEQALAPLVSTGRAEIAWLEVATLAELNRALQQHETHVLHFVGHGGFDEASGEGVLVLEGPNATAHEVPGSYLGTILSDHRSLRLVVLNACEGARSSARDPFSGVATSLIERDLPAVVAMQFEITDDAALVFASAFYRALVEGSERVDTAMAAARLDMYANDPDGLEWATPVLFSRVSDGLLFDFAPAPAVAPGPAPAVAPTTTIAPLPPPVPPAPEPSRRAEPTRSVPDVAVRDVSVEAAPPLRVHEAVRCEHGAAITAAALSRDGRWLVTAGADARVIVWASATGAPSVHWRLPAQPVDVSTNVDGSLVAVAAGYGCWIYATASAKQVALLAPGGDDRSYVRAVQFSPDGRVVVAGNDRGIVEAWSTGSWRSGARQVLGRRAHAVTAVRFHPGGGRVAVGAYTGAVFLWDFGVGKLFPLPAATTGGATTDLAYIPGAGYLAVASADGSALVVDTLANRVVTRLPAGAAVTSIDASPTGLVVLAGADDTLRGYRADGTAALEEPTTGTLRRTRFSSNGHGLLTAGSAGVASIWVVQDT
jgi:hypothetical protein